VIVGAFVGKAAGIVVTGLAGAAALEGVKKVAQSQVLHSTAVAVTSWGLRGARAAEVGAEKARLAASDIVSEARGRIGEQTPPPSSGTSADRNDGHGHEH
jgi:hypothetical protein